MINEISNYKTIGKYKYNPKYCLGQGSYGRVYIAEEIDTQIKVAIKELDFSQFEKDSYFKAQILNEIEVMKCLNHPNIVKLIDLYKSEKHFYIVTEYCKDGDLKYILMNKNLTENEAILMLQQLINGFKELQKNNVIHRDLKPSKYSKG